MQTLIQSPDLVHQALLPVTQVQPSATNPRKRITDEMIDDLAASIAKVGVLQPILVRTRFLDDPDDEAWNYEIVAGECRYRAAVKAGLEFIPATIRDLTDLEALELQVLENLHRNDLHPMEEAEGFRQLLDANGYTAATLASKIGKSKAYVYASLKLCELCRKGRDAFFEGKLTASTALLIARIPGEKLQEGAVDELTTPTVFYGGIPSYRDAAKIIQRKFTTDLDRAIFDEADPDLVPEAGSCIDCPKLSGNAREIFPDIKSADVCTDTTCFQAKRQAHIGRLKALPDTIYGEAALELLPKRWSEPQSSDYARRDDTPEGTAESWNDLLGDELPTRTVILDYEDDPILLVDVHAAQKLLKEKGIQPKPKKEREPTPYDIERTARLLAVTAEQKRRTSLLAALHRQLADGAMLKKMLTVAFPIMIVDLFERLLPDERDIFFAARDEENWLPVNVPEWGDKISELFQKDQSRLLIELLAVSDDEGVLAPGWNWNTNSCNELDIFPAILSAAGIDPDSNPGENSTDPTSAAHAEEEVACAERRDTVKTAAHAGEPDGEDQGQTPIQAASAATKRAAKKPAATTTSEAL